MSCSASHDASPRPCRRSAPRPLRAQSARAPRSRPATHRSAKPACSPSATVKAARIVASGDLHRHACARPPIWFGPPNVRPPPRCCGTGGGRARTRAAERAPYELDRARDALDGAQQLVRRVEAEVVAALARRRTRARPAAAPLPRVGRERRLEHERARQVAALAAELAGRPDRPVAGVGVEQAGEDRRAVEAAAGRASRSSRRCRPAPPCCSRRAGRTRRSAENYRWPNRPWWPGCERLGHGFLSDVGVSPRVRRPALRIRADLPGEPGRSAASVHRREVCSTPSHAVVHRPQASAKVLRRWNDDEQQGQAERHQEPRPGRARGDVLDRRAQGPVTERWSPTYRA